MVGAGASTLISDLIAEGYRSIEAIDIAAAALDQLATQLGDSADLVSRRVADVRTAVFESPIDVWHDRAVFHFLTSVADQSAYADRAAAAVPAGGSLVFAGFAPGGPTQCSGLDIAQHDAASLQSIFAGAFDVIESFERDHQTPWGTPQRFTHALLRRR